jgi:hypothetical protein
VRLDAMQASAQVRVTETPGGAVVHVGVADQDWLAGRGLAWAPMYADADACVTGRARRLEFQTPAGRVFARADPVNGVSPVH